MDPTATLNRALELIAQGTISQEDRMELANALFDLASWIYVGGFLPTLPKSQEV